MNDLLDLVRQFHSKTGQPIGDCRKPNLKQDCALRLELIREEFDELLLAMGGQKLVKQPDGRLLPETIPGGERGRQIAVADALGDMAYVIAGAAITWGIPLGEVCEEIHRSNMTKTADNKRADGKIGKGPDYVPPDLERVWQTACDFEDYLDEYNRAEGCGDPDCEGDHLSDRPELSDAPRIDLGIGGFDPDNDRDHD